MTPDQMDRMLRKILIMSNCSGARAVQLKARFKTGHVMPLDIWDCDDRAAYAVRFAVLHGYKAKTKVQRFADGRQAHRYVEITTKDGTKADLLRISE